MLWSIALACSAVRQYGPIALLVALSLLARRKWVPLAQSSEETVPLDRPEVPKTRAFVLLLSISAATAIFVFVSLRRGPLMWDESVFVFKAYGLSQGFRHLSFAEVWQAIATGDRLYPPASSLALGGIFTVFGSSQTTALACTIGGFVSVSVLMFTVGCMLDARRGHIVGLVAVLLFLGSPIQIEYAGTDMLEIPGTLATLVAIVAYLWHLRRSTELSALAVGLALVVTFFTKYNYGLFAIGAVALCQLSLKQWKPWTRENLWMWVPVAVLADLWFKVPDKWDGFVGFAMNHDSGMPMLSSASLLFYPRYFFSENTSSLPLGAVTLIAGIGAIRWAKSKEIRCVLLFFAVAFGALTVHHLKEDRYLATVAPVLFLLAAFTLVQMFEGLAVPWVRRSLVAIGALLLVPGAMLYAVGVPNLVSKSKPSWSCFPWPRPDIYPVTDFVLSHIDPTVPTTITGMVNEWSPEYIRWRIAMAAPLAKVNVGHFDRGKLNFVFLQLLPGSPYRTEEYYTFHKDIDAKSRILQSHVDGGIRTEAVFPSSGMKLVVITDAQLR